jgi:hypothetical protein
MATDHPSGRNASGKPSPIVCNLLVAGEVVELELDVDCDPTTGLVLVDVVRCDGELPLHSNAESRPSSTLRLALGPDAALDLALGLAGQVMRLRGLR